MHQKGKRRNNSKSKKSKSETRKSNETDAWKPASKAGRVVLRNLPFEVTEDGIEDHFLQFGDIRDIKLLRRQDGKLTGCGFVQFTRKEDASEAISNCSGKPFMGRKITVDWAVPKSEYIAMQIITRKSAPNDESKDITTKAEPENEEEGDLTDLKEEVKEDRGDQKPKKRKSVNDDDDDDVRESKKIKKERKKAPNRRGRIIVRNLPFKIKEKVFKKHFAKFGEVTESMLLRKPDGKLVGCGFIQFKTKQNAIKAILGCSGKELQGRVIICDWALPKDKYLASEAQASDKVEPKEESNIDGDSEPVVIKEEPEDEQKYNEASDEDTDLSDEFDDDDVDDDLPKKADLDLEPEKKRPRVISNDVSEGRTVFIKNVPFTVTNEELRECMEQFGPVFYALVCIDSLTEHSKGTAFAKFQTVESAEKCLSAGTELKLNDQILNVYKALNKDDLQKKGDRKSERAKDNRNLYLIKEGVILAGSPAAKGVSVSDMDKRLQLEQWKTQMLRNLNMFLSRTRLVVHNLSPTTNDDAVRQLFLAEAGPGAVITEARVMRDMRNMDAQGVGKSKEFAFVGFTTHEHALQALRNINNNPTMFSKAKRPIVAFSIENKNIHKVKQKRMLNSRAKNPLYNNTKKNTYEESKRGQINQKKSGKYKSETIEESTDPGNFTGVVAEPGIKRLRTKFNLKTQSALHIQSVRKDKHNRKMSRKMIKQKNIMNESLRQPKQKQNSRRKRKTDDEDFSKLVNKYKSKLTSLETQKKWYE